MPVAAVASDSRGVGPRPGSCAGCRGLDRLAHRTCSDVRAAGLEADVVAADLPGVGLAGQQVRARRTTAAGRARRARSTTPSRASNGSRLTHDEHACRRRRASRSAIRWSFSVSRNVRLSSRCSARFSRRISFSRRTSGSSGPSSVRFFDLVLLRVEVLLAALAARARSRSARSRSRCRRSARASPRARAAPRTPAGRRLRYSWRMSGVFAKKFGRKKSASTSSELGHVLDELPLRVLPREVRVGLVEADLARASCIIAGRVNASARKTTLRVAARGPRAISHSQNGSGFVCGLSTRKTRTPRVDPVAGRRRAAPPRAPASPRSRS